MKNFALGFAHPELTPFHQILWLCFFGFSFVGPTSHRIAWVVLGSDYGAAGIRIGKSKIDRLARGVLWTDIQGLWK